MNRLKDKLMSWRREEDEKLEGRSPERELKERSRHRRLAGGAPEMVPARKFPARLRIWRLVRLKSPGGTSPERELLFK